jgi:hypothetical protein
MNKSHASKLVETSGNVQVFHRRLDLGDYGPEFGGLAALTMSEVEKYDNRRSTEHFYANPEWTVIAPGTTPEVDFLKQAERACTRWKIRLRRTLGIGPVRRMLRAMEHGDTLLVGGGMLYLQGMPAHLKRLNWRASSQQAPR